MGSRLEYYILFFKFKQQINVGKGIKFQKAQRAISSYIFNFVFRYLVLGLLIIFMKDFPLDMNMGYRIAFGILLIVYSFIRGIRIINDNKD
jgi:undecaprenyl pyrophosphate phosphatase UppP